MADVAPAPIKQRGYPDYKQEFDKCLDFLKGYKDEIGGLKYVNQLQSIANRETSTIEIEVDDLQDFADDTQFASNVAGNTKSYLNMFSKAIDSLMPEADQPVEPDIHDVLHNHRMQNAVDGGAFAADSLTPPELTRRYQLRIIPPSTNKRIPLRSVKSSCIGSLVSVKGIVTRMSNVMPKCTVATYLCETCGHEIYQIINSRSYTPLFTCPSQVCQQNSRNGRLFPQTRGSRFEKFQELYLQELPEEVPVGNVPRSLTIYVNGDLTRSCNPGDIVTVQGIFLVQPFKGFRAMRAGLSAETFIEAQKVTNHKKNYRDISLSSQEERELKKMARDRDLYRKMASSIAPEIFGMSDVKKALLLLLVGGVTREMNDNMKIRGDINILLCGDPGVAKSQLLKHLCKIAPRAVYTTGKGSSGVGLTAAVIRDQVTGDMTLEGGALVLADMGICCIDEFDKMDETDQTAIHEVMEQQTVSIAKAGITTTLNARTSILAAANPVFGRYKTNATPEQNVNLPTALLSRFDLVYLLLDKADQDRDRRLAEHVAFVHMNNCHPELDFNPYSPKLMRSYISLCKSAQPFVPPSLVDHIVAHYLSMRQSGQDSFRDKARTTFCTPRSLLSLLRFSQALARLRLAKQVSRADVEEAIRLQEISRAAAQKEDDDDKGDDNSSISKIYRLINAYITKDNKTSAKYDDVQHHVSMKGYTESDFEACLDEYQTLNVLQVTRNRQRILLVDTI
eukprot:CAMPEP_0114538230 /NCGR_PEP_ID=MMETSP0109-20121206/30021_1 /TAXON_ID=29199 /ORGANISM="Chlorarachnion reptans, Strain CCCM449" /LENGTH=733 /DNA_ID=CAMNT_0001722213 /DNA_START=132 /DNA_END=2333 /DNA_ORIENTATION=-